MLFFVVILINFNYIRKIIKSSLGATEGLVQQSFASMATLGNCKKRQRKTNRRKKLNISADSTPLKASDRNVSGQFTETRRK